MKWFKISKLSDILFQVYSHDIWIYVSNESKAYRFNSERFIKGNYHNKSASYTDRFIVPIGDYIRQHGQTFKI